MYLPCAAASLGDRISTTTLGSATGTAQAKLVRRVDRSNFEKCMVDEDDC